MEEINRLLEVTDRLIGPGGCPWDQKQTMKSIRQDLLEEACEFLEAIDLEDNLHMEEELGDLLFVVVFLGRLAEKEKRFTLNQAAKGITEKLISRHPHVFGEGKVDSAEAVMKQWEQLKSKEKGKSHRESVLDGIPKGLPSLARGKKMIKKMRKKNYGKLPDTSIAFNDEEELGRVLYEIVCQAEKQGLEPEEALRKVLAKEEKAFRRFEVGDS